MEVLMDEEYFIIVDGDHSLWCSRTTGNLTAKNASTLTSKKNYICLGVVYGIIGKFQIHADAEKKLLLIRQRALVGHLPGGHDVFKIQKIAVLPLNQHDVPELEIELCKKHHLRIRKSDKSSTDSPQRPFQKTWNQIRTVTSQTKPRRKENKDREKLERRILDELLKMFTDTDSFYYSLTGDITNSLQRQQMYINCSSADVIPLWKRTDERFFWNRHMLMELIESWNPQSDHWIVPIIQGFVQIEKCWIDGSETTPSISPEAEIDNMEYLSKQCKEYTMAIISRRSRYRAGTRYKRRGVDEDGKCANYVETEQIFEYLAHIVSFAQVRGSVPVFWSQPGYKYRPPPRLDRGEEETQIAFQKHFAEELSIYHKQAIINLAEQAGKEKVLCDAYLNSVLDFNCPDLIYVAFDFHEYCRGMKFENVTVLTESIKDIIKDMRYCWFDSQGLICEQKGVFRINCVDCLDRTNIVQTAIAKTVMDIQFIKLGLLPPEGMLPASCRRVFQMMWANNGDIISRQYAGTAALKGDFTRTGERRFAGMMKDGYNSASRYYVNQFKDAYRQATIDMMLGNSLTEDITAVTPERETVEAELEATEQEHHERVKQLIEHCKKILIPDTEFVLGGWALIDADPITGDPGQQDMDIILVLTKDSYYVAEYDDQTDRIIRYQRVLLEDLERIELGPEPSLFKSKHNCLRFHYLVNSQSGYFHMFRSTNTRFFNNMAVPICSEEEAAESLKAICEAFKVALGVRMLNVPFFEGKLERRKSKMPFTHGGVNNCNYQNTRHGHGLVPFHLELPSFSAMPRNISEGQLNALKSVGTRALNNMTSHFAKLNPIRSVRGLGKRNNGMMSSAPLAAVVEPCGTLQRPLFHVDSSSDSEDDSVRRRKKQSSAAFLPYINDRTLSSDYSECSDLDEQDMALTESLERDDENGSQDTLLESCGILATSPSLKISNSILGNLVIVEDHFGHVNTHAHADVEIDDFVLDAMKRASLRQLRRQTSHEASSMLLSSNVQPSITITPHPSMPQIHVSHESLMGPSHSKSGEDLSISIGKSGSSKKLSKSTEDLDSSRPTVTASSNEVTHLLIQEEMVLDTESMSSKMKTSHSESAIQDFSLPSLNLPNPLSSPIIIKKDLVLSPLSRIAKGVQNLGLNLRPNVKTQRSPDTEEYEQMKEKRKHCKTRILEL